jgi:hypothetical protein
MIIRAILFSVFFSLISLTSRSQTDSSEIKLSQLPSVSGENIKLLTDRSIYCVNEKIYFTAGYSCINELASLSWSNVLYVELIKWNGIKLVQMKMNLNRPGTSGSMKIPGNLLSGNYYLRAYTKWMRNFSAGNYAYLLVKIVNPFRSETDEGPPEISTSDSTETPNIMQKIMIKGISCIMDKSEYKTDEKAEIELQLSGRKLFDPYRYCVSVAKVGAIDTAVQSFEHGSAAQEGNPSDIEYLPEIRGITISGKVIDRLTKLPQKKVWVNLSETRHGEYFSVYQTNDMGRFVFSLPDMKGQYDFFIQSAMPSEIKIDNSFCDKPVKLPYVTFSLNKDELDLVKEMSINQQLSERFLSNKDTLENSQYTKAEPLAFFGSKRSVYYTAKYIELPNIEEFIKEIVLDANLRNEKGKASSIILNRTNLSNYSPLIFMDNIQINNDIRLLKVPLNKIEKVEVLNMDYVVAGLKYSGIISISSRNKDFAGLDLNKNSSFFTYDLFSDIDSGYDYNKRPSDARIPDKRNLLYWDPDIQLSTRKKSVISFYTADCKGEYVMFIRGIDSKTDHEIYGTCYFTVK